MANYAQLYNLINATTQGVIGGTAITVRDTSSLVSLGNVVLSTDQNKEEFYNKLADMIGRIVCRYKQIRKSNRGIEVDPLEFGIALQEITVKTIARAKQNNSWGNQVNPFDVLRKDDTDLAVYIFKSLGGWEIDKITYDYQLQTAFHNGAEMGSFLSLIFADAANGMTMAANDNERNVEATSIGLAFDGTKTGIGRQTAFNFYTLFKAQYPQSALTVAQAKRDPEFLRFCTDKMLEVLDNAYDDVSTLYNYAGHETQLDDDFKLHMLSEFANKLSIYLRANTYHEDLLKIPGFKKVNSWLGLGSDASFDEKSKIAVENGDLNVTQGGVVAHLFASPHMLTVIDKPRTKSIYNPASELTNWYYKADIGYIIRPYEVNIVFYIAETDWAPSAQTTSTNSTKRTAK